MNERKISALPRSQVLALAREILLPEAVIADLSAALPAEIPDSLCLPLTRPEQAFSHWKELVSQPAFCDERGIHLLGIYLTAACHTRKLYQSIGIPDSIFLDTMGCFSRFLQEAQARSGRFHFDRGFWAWRHLCCRLFRLGTLEFEYRTVGTAPSLPAQLQPDSPVLFVHIPSNARLFQPTLSDSYQKAALFFAKYAPALCTSGPPQAILCCSWLLSLKTHSTENLCIANRREIKDPHIFFANSQCSTTDEMLEFGLRSYIHGDISDALKSFIIVAKGGKNEEVRNLAREWKEYCEHVFEMRSDIDSWEACLNQHGTTLHEFMISKYHISNASAEKLFMALPDSPEIKVKKTDL